MKNIGLMFILYFIVSNFIFASALEVDVLKKSNGYVSAKISGKAIIEDNFYLSCFSHGPIPDSGTLSSSIQLVFLSDEEKLNHISLENQLEIKKNNKEAYQILSSGAFSSASDRLYLGLHHLIRREKKEQIENGISTIVETISVKTVVVLSLDPDELFVSNLSSKSWLNRENDFFEFIEKNRATVLTIYEFQM